MHGHDSDQNLCMVLCFVKLTFIAVLDCQIDLIKTINLKTHFGYKVWQMLMLIIEINSKFDVFEMNMKDSKLLKYWKLVFKWLVDFLPVRKYFIRKEVTISNEGLA